jgi:hypothetical protein
MIKKSSLCNRRLKNYINDIHRPDIKALAIKRINRAFSLKKDFTFTADTTDVTLSKALEFYAAVVMSEKFLIEANSFLMEHTTSARFVKPWAKELHELWQLLQQQIVLGDQLIRSIIQQREKERELCQKKDTSPASDSTMDQ